MKLFQQLLVAGSALSMLAPIGVQASEINLEGINSYASSKSKSSSNKEVNITSFSNEVATLKEIDSSPKNNINNFEAGSFSETTSMSGYAAFQVGTVDEGNLTEAVTSTYSYYIDLNSSFTGDDNLYVGIETGNASGVNFVTDDSLAGGDSLSVASMYYQFPLGNYDIAVGPKLDNDDLMPTTISTYSDKFFMAGYSLLESNSYLYGYTGGGIAVSTNFDNGFNASGSVIATNSATSAGVLTKEGIDIITLSAGYDGDNYGGGIVYVDGDNYCGLVNSYISNGCTTLGVSTLEVDVVGIGAYWTPNEGKTTFSATTNLIQPTVTGIDIDNISDLQFAVEHGLGDGVLSASWKSIPFYNVVSSTEFDQDDLGSYFELYYTQPVNDSLDLTYGIAMADPNTEASDSFSLYDYTAIGAQATFKF